MAVPSPGDWRSITEGFQEHAVHLDQLRLQIVDEVEKSEKICAEFHRITNLDLKNHFYAVLDQHAPRLQSLFRKKAVCTGNVSDEQADIHAQRAGVLHALPAYLYEDTSTFIKTWDMMHTDRPDISEVPLGLLLIRANSSDATFFCPEKTAVLVEGNMIIDFTTLADAFLVIFGLTYALHLSYPKCLAKTFDFIQKVLMGLDGLKPKVLSLKNELLAAE
ncbi:splicing factor 3A subunit 1 [Sarotherodon galilaeus]